MKRRLVVVGAAGRMGKRIISLAVGEGRFEIAGVVDRVGHPDIGKDAGTVAGVGRLNVAIKSDFPAAADVVIDFSLAEAADATIDHCAKSGMALVIGTTGLSGAQREKVKAAGAKIAVIYGTNMSVGMNVLFSLVGKAAAMLGQEYDIEIVEQHHRFKKDAPSGSALTLAERICEATGRDVAQCVSFGREGKDALRKKGEIGIHAVRAGDIAGIHSIFFSTLGETVMLNHTAHSRDGFARGALRAAAWLVDRQPGTYSMADVLGIA